MKTYRVFLEHPTLAEDGESIIKVEQFYKSEHSGKAHDQALADWPEFVVFDVVEVE